MAVAKNFWKIVDKVINSADVILEIVDASHPDETRNKEIEEKVKKRDKILITVVNKIDLTKKAKFKGLIRPILISTKSHIGIGRLRSKIMAEAARAGVKSPLVGVVGYPNVGKSSVINSLKGRRSARTSSSSGFTKGLQNIRGGANLMLIDSPGVIPYGEHDDIKHIKAQIKNPESIKDPIGVVLQIIKENPGKLQKHYGVSNSRAEDKEEIIERIAQKKHILKKGGVPDTDRMALFILKDVYKGKIKI
ncbi:MAG: GTPase [Candidatus Aenigmatarchaeota archaeon]